MGKEGYTPGIAPDGTIIEHDPKGGTPHEHIGPYSLISVALENTGEDRVIRVYGRRFLIGGSRHLDDKVHRATHLGDSSIQDLNTLTAVDHYTVPNNLDNMLRSKIYGSTGENTAGTSASI